MNERLSAHPIPDEALDEDIAILGRKGGGKSYTAKGIVERLLDMGRRVLVLDPLGVWAGLRTSADGESPGYPIAIFGGLHGDLPLDTAMAEPLARILATENLPAVVDLSELSKSAQQAFLLKFLHELRRVNREALTVVLEEADVFSPQQPQGDDSKALHAEIDWIARRGRFRGFRLLTITQRPARLSKDVLTQANMLIMHRLPSPQDQGAGLDWIKSNGDLGRAKEVENTLGSLRVGEAWVLAQSPHMLERASFPRIKTLDTSATPKAGETRIEPKTLAEVDVSAIAEALKVSTEEEEEAPSRKGKAPSADPAALTAAEERGYQRGVDETHAAGTAALTSLMDWMVQKVGDWQGEIRDQFAQALEGRVVPPVPSATAAAPEPRKAATRPPTAPRAATGEMTSNPFYQAALSIYPVKMTWGQLGVLAQRKTHGGSFNTAKKRLLSEGYLIEDGEFVVLVQPPDVPSGTVLANLLEQRLPTVPAEMFKTIRRYPGQTIEALADRLGKVPRGGSWNTGMSILTKNDIVLNAGGRLKVNPNLLVAV